VDADLIKRVTRELEGVDWFAMAGKPTSSGAIGCSVIADERQAIRHLKSSASEFGTQEAQAWLTMTLSRDFKEQYRDWNKVGAKARAFYDKRVKPALDDFAGTHRGWGKALEDSVTWDVVHIFIEKYYVGLCLPRPMFFTRQLEVFSGGRMPCEFVYEGDIYDAFRDGTGHFLCF
jgi:hypothetical protein